MQDRIFPHAWWVRAATALPGLLFFSLWLVVAVSLKFEPLATVLIGLFLAPFIILSLGLSIYFHRRAIRVDARGIKTRRGGKNIALAWSEIHEFHFDRLAGGRNSTLLYECRGPAGVIRFHRVVWPGEKDNFDGADTGASPIEPFSKATWSPNTRGTHLKRKDLEALRDLIIQRTSRQLVHFPGLLQRPLDQ